MSKTHDELVDIAGRWLARNPSFKSRGKEHHHESWPDHRGECVFVLTEAGCWMSAEIPDAIGWWGGWTFLIECKVTRSDFKADAKKDFRVRPEWGAGDFRYYMTTGPDIISEDDLPDGWGLLHLTERGRVMVKRHAERQEQKSLHTENHLVIAAMRRVIFSPEIRGLHINLSVQGRDRVKTSMIVTQEPIDE